MGRLAGKLLEHGERPGRIKHRAFCADLQSEDTLHYPQKGANQCASKTMRQE